MPLAALILLAFVVGMEFLLVRTTFGRNVFAVGGNLEAARRAGINTVIGFARQCSASPDRWPRSAESWAASRLLRRQPIIGRKRLAAARDCRTGHRRNQPLRWSRFGLVGSARCIGDRFDLQRHGSAGLRIIREIHGHRCGSIDRGDHRRPGAQAASNRRPRLEVL